MADNVDTTDLQPHVQAHNSTRTSTTCRENGSSPRLKVECTGPRGGLEGESEGDTLVDCQEANMDVEMSRYGADDPTEPVLSLRMLMNSKVSECTEFALIIGLVYITCFDWFALNKFLVKMYSWYRCMPTLS